MKVLVETSARHIHVSRADFEKLFGADAQLTNKKDLSQPGQFACFEKVTVVGPRGELTMSILGPERPDTQVEVAYTDARKLGIVPPVRESGDVAGSPGCKLVGPKGEIEIDCGIIVAKRHIHLTPADGEEMGLKDKQIVSVKVGTPGDRETVFNDVVVRVSKNYKKAMHVDTDEANAAGLSGEVYGEVIK
jgi:putative phosphotransacetylase